MIFCLIFVHHKWLKGFLEAQKVTEKRDLSYTTRSVLMKYLEPTEKLHWLIFSSHLRLIYTGFDLRCIEEDIFFTLFHFHPNEISETNQKFLCESEPNVAWVDQIGFNYLSYLDLFLGLHGEISQFDREHLDIITSVVTSIWEVADDGENIRYGNIFGQKYFYCLLDNFGCFTLL